MRPQCNFVSDEGAISPARGKVSPARASAAGASASPRWPPAPLPPEQRSCATGAACHGLLAFAARQKCGEKRWRTSGSVAMASLLRAAARSAVGGAPPVLGMSRRPAAFGALSRDVRPRWPVGGAFARTVHSTGTPPSSCAGHAPVCRFLAAPTASSADWFAPTNRRSAERIWPRPRSWPRPRPRCCARNRSGGCVRACVSLSHLEYARTPVDAPAADLCTCRRRWPPPLAAA
jgi:hypothetical protein